MAQYAGASGVGNIAITSGASSNSQAFNGGTSFSGASSFQQATMTMQPTIASTYTSETANMAGTVQTKGNSFAFNNSTGLSTGSALAGGQSVATVTGNVKIPDAGMVGAAAAQASNTNFAASGTNDANSNASVSGANFTVGLNNTLSYQSSPGADYNGWTQTSTVSNGGSSFTSNVAQTGQAALAFNGVTSASGPISNIGAGDSNLGYNTPNNATVGNASFWSNATVDNSHTTTLNATQY
jgi:hypothetical protein